jgi:hypothetical protein
MRRLVWIVVAPILAGFAGCDWVQEWQGRAEPHEQGRLALSVEAPGALDWGGTGAFRLALENEGAATVDGALVEVFVPAWIELGPVGPTGTEVRLVSGEAGTRLAYQLTDPLGPGERRTVIQQLRVKEAGPPTAGVSAGDRTGALARPAPADRVMRARLLDAAGQAIGPEIRVVLGFSGAPAVLTPEAPATAHVVVRSDRVGGIRLGMSLDQLRRDAAGARDTTLVGAGGTPQRALLVPGSDGPLLAVIADGRVERILVRSAGVFTEQGLGVGSQLRELRQVYGSGCGEVVDGRVTVRFPSGPGLSFVLNAIPPDDEAALRHDLDALPDSARVTEIMVLRADGDC